MLTPWFPVGVYPVRDGLYVARWVMADGFPGLCWHLMRWHGGTRRWYSADSVDQKEWHVIGGGWKENRDAYQWRGLAERPFETGELAGANRLAWVIL